MESDRPGSSTTSYKYALCKLRDQKLSLDRIRRYPNLKSGLLERILGASARNYIAEFLGLEPQIILDSIIFKVGGRSWDRGGVGWIYSI
jgi:hypothetical protein